MVEPALYKFLEANLACPVTGRIWPAPVGAGRGSWVEREGPFDPDGLGFLVFRDRDLAPWASAQLFRVEMVNGFLFIAAIAHAVPSTRHATDATARHAAFMHERALQSRLIAERLAG